MTDTLRHKRVLLTGGLGYLGAHVTAELAEAGCLVAVLGPASVRGKDTHRRLQQLTGLPVPWFTGDVRDPVLLTHAFEFFRPDAVCHFAGLKPGTKEPAQPFDFMSSHVGGLLSLLEAMNRFEVRNLLFSSSAAVYCPHAELPVSETASLRPVTPYGNAKLICEQVLAQQALTPGWRIANLRCFNPAGAHHSGLLGEPYLTAGGGLFKQVARVLAGLQESVPVFGDHWPTGDGTQVRDYFHVMDLARGCVAALAHLEATAGLATWNIGSGRGYSVRDVVSAFEAAAGRAIPITVHAARTGDTHTSVADIKAVQGEIGWCPEYALSRMCEDTVRHVQQSQMKGAYGGA